ncbi:MAG TPA: hypothetical protein VNC85_06055, partial [Mycobacteriales bacterium]|nr:hypothetical protein [Mycobacteriales bacterium]
MSAKPEAYDQALDRAARHARSWLASLPDRPVPPRLTADELAEALAAGSGPAIVCLQAGNL